MTNVIIVGIGLIAGIVGIVAFCRTRMTIDPDKVLDNSNPLSTTFRISNDGNLSVNSIKYEFALLHFSSSGKGNIEIHGRNAKVTDSSRIIPVLKPDEKTSLIFPPAFNRMVGIVTQCEIEVAFSYRPSYWPFTKEKRYRFLADNANGQWKWLPKATSEKY